jgi:hypothetical protein
MLIMKKSTIAALVQPLAGQQLPADWQRTATETGGTFDRRDLSQLWKTPQWSSKLNGDNIDNLMRNARLSSVAASGI